MASSFRTLKTELLSHTGHATRDAATRELFVYIETHDNRLRFGLALGYRTAGQAELQTA